MFNIGRHRLPSFNIAGSLRNYASQTSRRACRAGALPVFGDSSLIHDRKRKLEKYARTRVPEYWIVNLKQDVIEVYRKPEDGAYLDKTVAKMGDVVAPLAFPDVTVVVEEIIPSR